MDDRGIKIAYDAPDEVRAALEGIGRTEDLAFSPSNGRLAIAAFERNSIVIIDVDIRIGGHRPHVTIAHAAEFSSPCLNGPHGIEFLDDQTVIVANRYGNVTLLRLSPENALDGVELTPIALPPGRRFEFLSEASSLTIVNTAEDSIEVLICNNAGDTITRHVLEDEPSGVGMNEVLLHRWLDRPDGVAVSADNRWIAISNHDAHNVMVYERSPSLAENSDPDAILRGAFYPHGLWFSADARHLFVADAGNPNVHVYARDGRAWRGVQQPAASVRVMDDDVFRLGLRIGPEHGGPKGIAVDRRGDTLAVTSSAQPLAFFDVSMMLERCAGRCPDHTLRVSHELQVLEAARLTAARVAALQQSTSFRITKPLRLVKTTWSRMRR